MQFFSFDKNKTFKPLKGHKSEKSKVLHQFAKATLGSGDMRLAVQSPEGEDECEWLAVHTVDFFNEVSLLYGTVAEFCTKASCPTMSAGSRFEYLWADGVTVTKPIKVTAPEYVDLLMTWVEGQINSERLFPTSTACAFPRDFKSVVSNIFKRLFRVYAHIYYSHFDKIVALGAERHLNTCFKHFIFFVKQFALIDAKELAPLDELIAGLMGGGDGPSGAGAGGPGAAAPAAGRGGGAASSSSGAAKA